VESLESFPAVELFLNALGILLSLLSLYYWIMLYKKIYRKKNEFQGWIWLFACAFAILLLNLSSTYMLLAGSQTGLNLSLPGVKMDFRTLQVLEVLSRAIIVFSMTVGVYLIYSPLKSGFVYALTAVELKEQQKATEKLKYSINPGVSYLVSEKSSTDIYSERSASSAGRSSPNGMQVFIDVVSHGVYGLMVTREYPRAIRSAWNVDSLPLVWVTTSTDTESMLNVQCIDPLDLIGLGHMIKEFIRKNSDCVVILDCAEYLITQNSFNDFLIFLQALNDTISQSKSRLVVPVDYKALSEANLHMLKRELSEKIF
jgi:hypothetical protein